MLQSEAIKEIAATLTAICENLGKIAANNPKLGKDIWDYKDNLDQLNAILDAELEAPKSAKKERGERKQRGTYHYEGIDAAALAESDRPAVIELKVMKGDDEVLKFCVDRTFRWILKQNKDLDWYACARISLNAKSKHTLALCLKKLADKEVREPGSFAEKYLPPTIN
jgi:hypothetical protein